jgi:hypothetical protein
MPAKMTVLSLAHTGHVLAAIAEPPSGPASLEALVGAAFPLRTTRVRTATGGAFDASFALPASLLESKSIAYDGRVIARPQSFVVDGGLAVELPAGTAPAGGLTTSAVTVTLSSAVAADTKVLVIVGDQIDPRIQRIQAGAIPATLLTVDLNLTIVPEGPAATLAASTGYFVAFAVEGSPLAYGTETIP